ncbi:hypothetical protein ACOME3_005932 [Neoechinorhynchus agilis]
MVPLLLTIKRIIIPIHFIFLYFRSFFHTAKSSPISELEMNLRKDSNLINSPSYDNHQLSHSFNLSFRSSVHEDSDLDGSSTFSNKTYYNPNSFHLPLLPLLFPYCQIFSDIRT